MGTDLIWRIDDSLPIEDCPIVRIGYFNVEIIAQNLTGWILYHLVVCESLHHFGRNVLQVSPDSSLWIMGREQKERFHFFVCRWSGVFEAMDSYLPHPDETEQLINQLKRVVKKENWVRTLPDSFHQRYESSRQLCHSFLAKWTKSELPTDQVFKFPQIVEDWIELFQKVDKNVFEDLYDHQYHIPRSIHSGLNERIRPEYLSQFVPLAELIDEYGTELRMYIWIQEGVPIDQAPIVGDLAGDFEIYAVHLYEAILITLYFADFDLEGLEKIKNLDVGKIYKSRTMIQNFVKKWKTEMLYALSSNNMDQRHYLDLLAYQIYDFYDVINREERDENWKESIQKEIAERFGFNNGRRENR